MIKLSCGIIAALLVLVALPARADEILTEKSILTTSIGKWQNLVVRKGSQQRPDDSAPSGLAAAYYAVDIDSFTRDRDGQGVYREGVTRLLHCEAGDVTVTRGAGDGLELQMRIEQSQGTGNSEVLITASKLAGADEPSYAVRFSGTGGVCDAFLARFTEAVSGAEWVESIDKLHWQLDAEDPDLGVAANGSTAGGSDLREMNLFTDASELDPAVYPIGWANGGTQLALLIAHPFEAGEEREWEILLTDLVTDKIVVSRIIPVLPSDGLPEFLAAHAGEIETICASNGVVRSPMEIHPFPALLDPVGGRRRSAAYGAGCIISRLEEPDKGQGDFRERLEVKLSSGSESKNILDQSWPTWDSGFSRAAGIVGYIPSPDPSRIAVIVGLVERGYEGAPHPRRILIAGAGIGSKF